MPQVGRDVTWQHHRTINTRPQWAKETTTFGQTNKQKSNIRRNNLKTIHEKRWKIYKNAKVIPQLLKKTTLIRKIETKANKTNETEEILRKKNKTKQLKNNKTFAKKCERKSNHHIFCRKTIQSDDLVSNVTWDKGTEKCESNNLLINRGRKSVAVNDKKKICDKKTKLVACYTKAHVETQKRNQSPEKHSKVKIIKTYKIDVRVKNKYLLDVRKYYELKHDGNNAVNCGKNKKYKSGYFKRRVKVLKRDNEITQTRWNFYFTIISLLVLNAAVATCEEDEASSFTAGVTSRMIASLLGYPHTCTHAGQSRQCTLTISCWLRGGTRLRGCGGWLFTCCGPKEFDNSIQSSDWKYKVSPPQLHQVPQRMMPNVFRRRVDDDVTQLECGLPASRILQKRIIGGREARSAEFPWQAHVRISEFQCGGVLVSRWYVATAAHCVSRAMVRDIVVWLGAVDTSDTYHYARKIGVVKKLLHPLFQYRVTQPDRYDVALLRLSRGVAYSPHILPICLPDQHLELRGRSGVIAGWGKTDASNGHTGTNLLRSATVPILSKEQCIKWHQIKQISVEIHSEMICAGHSDGHQDACLGDSGGPLIVLDNGRYYLVGITSAGFGCGVDHQPGIYHNVKLTANWIRTIISPALNYNDI